MLLDSATAEALFRALTCSGEELAAIIPDASVETIRNILKNPALTESHLLLLLKRRDLSEELIKHISKLPLTSANHNLQVALSRHPKTPGAQLLAVLPHLYLFELLNLCILPEILPDQKVAAERAIIQRLPTTPLGNKLTLARRATSSILEALLKEADPRLMDACLANPQLKEGAVFQFLRSSRSDAESISLVARHPRWQSRPNIREAILTNPKTPLIWFTLWLPQMKRSALLRIAASNRLNSLQKSAVEERLKG